MASRLLAGLDSGSSLTRYFYPQKASPEQREMIARELTDWAEAILEARDSLEQFTRLEVTFTRTWRTPKD